MTDGPGDSPKKWDGSKGTDDEERIAGRVSYLDVLNRLHTELHPALYLEIGVRHGRSLALARGQAIGVDPMPEVDRALPTTTQVVTATSDDFFAAGAAGSGVDFCFIDGLHRYENVLRDFMNVERRAVPGAVVVIDDIFPNHPAQAERERRTQVWTGDVWRLVAILRRLRPDLFMVSLDARPAGLLLVAGLDPSNRVLWDNRDAILRTAEDEEPPPASVLTRVGALDPSGADFERILTALRDSRGTRRSPDARSTLSTPHTHRL